MHIALDDDELAQVRAAARELGMSPAEWVRQALRRPLREQPTRPAEQKLEAIRIAACHEFPTADLDQMLDEIEHGYGSSH